MYVKEKESLAIQRAAYVVLAHCGDALTWIWNDAMHG